MKRKIMLVLMALTLVFSSLAFVGCSDSDKDGYDDCFVIESGMITGLTAKGKTHSKLVIPNKIKGKSVTGIKSLAFADCDNLNKITIPMGITVIENSALSGCKNLTQIIVDESNPNYSSLDGNLYNKSKTTLLCYAIGKTATSFAIPNSVENVGVAAFSGSEFLQSVTIPSGVTSLSSGAFSMCSELTSIALPSTLTTIGEYAFSRSGLTSLEIPNGVVTINDYAFYDCNDLQSISISSSLQSLGTSAFCSCDALTSITVDSENQYFSSLGGNLYNKTQTRIRQYAIGKTATSFTLPNTVTSIGDRVFEDCKSITSIIIPSRITSVGFYAFSECDNLTIYCEVTSKPSDWSISWNYSHCPVYWYSETEPTTLGNYWHYVNGVVTIW